MSSVSSKFSGSREILWITKGLGPCVKSRPKSVSSIHARHMSPLGPWGILADACVMKCRTFLIFDHLFRALAVIEVRRSTMPGVLLFRRGRLWEVVGDGRLTTPPIPSSRQVLWCSCPPGRVRFTPTRFISFIVVSRSQGRQAYFSANSCS